MGPIKHEHMIVRAEIKSPPLPGAKRFLEGWFKGLVSDMGMNLLSGPHLAYVDKRGNVGWTGVCLIETSHVVAHFWNEGSPGLVQADFYSCSKLDPHVVLRALDVFDPVKVEYRFMDREHGLKILKRGRVSR